MTNLQELSRKGILFDGHYKLLRPLSTDGATADVWLARDENTVDTDFDEENGSKKEESGMLVAIKIYRPKNALDIEGEKRFRSEYKIVYECRHANLLQPTGFSICGENPYLVLPYCENGSSEKLIGKKLTDQEIWKYILDVSSGLNRLHTNEPQIIHQDIKPANILIDNMHNYAITDFGISSRRGGVHEHYDEENSGTMAYMAPERFKEEAIPIPESDIWGFGAALFEILTGKIPFGEDGGMIQDKTTPLPVVPNVTTSIQHLIHACLNFDPAKRPSASELMEAANAKQYPVKHKKWIWLLLAAVITLLAGICIWILLNNKKEDPIPIDVAFKQASEWMENTDTAVFLKGYRIMDSLSNQKYTPAMYEIALTHGWFTLEKSLLRKDMLGIAYERDDIATKYMPINDEDNEKAMSLFREILKDSDTCFAYEKGLAAYTLAIYYINDGTFVEKDKMKSMDYLLMAQKWAEQSNDSKLMEMTNNAINILKNN